MESVNIVRTSANARINRLPITSYHRRIAWLLGFVFFFDHADINTLSYAAPAIMKQWHVSISTIAFLVSATFMGMFVGATFGGWLSDRIGRKKALIATTLWSLVSPFSTALHWSRWGYLSPAS